MNIFITKIILTCCVVLAFILPFFYPSLGSGFLEELELLGVGGALALLGVFLLLVFFYCKDLEKTLKLVSKNNRAATPKSVWFMFLIPYNFVEDFFIIFNIAKSLKSEAQSNPILSQLKYYGLYTGLGWCTAQIISLAPGYLGKTASLVAIILWVVHWRFIRKVNARLSQKV